MCATHVLDGCNRTALTRLRTTSCLFSDEAYNSLSMNDDVSNPPPPTPRSCRHWFTKSYRSTTRTVPPTIFARALKTFFFLCVRSTALLSPTLYVTFKKQNGFDKCSPEATLEKKNIGCILVHRTHIMVGSYSCRKYSLQPRSIKALPPPPFRVESVRKRHTTHLWGASLVPGTARSPPASRRCIYPRETG